MCTFVHYIILPRPIIPSSGQLCLGLFHCPSCLRLFHCPSCLRGLYTDLMPNQGINSWYPTCGTTYLASHHTTHLLSHAFLLNWISNPNDSTPPFKSYFAFSILCLPTLIPLSSLTTSIPNFIEDYFPNLPTLFNHIPSRHFRTPLFYISLLPFFFKVQSSSDSQHEGNLSGLPRQENPGLSTQFGLDQPYSNPHSRQPYNYPAGLPPNNVPFSILNASNTVFPLIYA